MQLEVSINLLSPNPYLCPVIIQIEGRWTEEIDSRSFLDWQ